MAWTTPVTDRESGAICTTTDMNRISGNIDWLATELASAQLYTGGTVSKTSWTTNDYITTGDWADIIDVLEDMRIALALEDTGALSNQMTYENMNAVEALTLRIYERLQLLLDQANANHYAGDNIFTEGAGSIYSAGLAV